MTTFLIILAVVVVIIFVAGASKQSGSTSTKSSVDTGTNNYYSSKKTNSQTSTPTNSSENVPTVAELVNDVKTLDDLRRFEKKEKEIEAKYGEDLENKHYGKLYQRYTDAFSKLCDKILFYQYVPELSTDTPLATLLDAYKYYTVDDYKQRKKGTKPDHWQEVNAGQIMGQTIESALVPKPHHLNTLMKFRETVESTFTSEDKSTAIRELISKDIEFKKMFFSVDNETEKLIKRYSKTKKTTA